MKDLLDEELIAKAVWECLKESDPEGGVEILEAHISAKNKSQLGGALEALENKIDLEDAKKALRDIEKHGTVSWEDTKRELGL